MSSKSTSAAIWRIRIFVSTLCISCINTYAQIPLIPTGAATITPRYMSEGLRFEAFSFSPDNTGNLQRVSTSDVALIPDHPTGLMAVAYFGGRIELMDDTGAIMDTPLIDIAATNPNLDVAIAHGITAMAIHPDFARPDQPGYGKIYVVETESNVGSADFINSARMGTHHQEALYEYTLGSHDELVCGAGCTKREVFRVQQPGWHHNIGDMLFGPDQMLYISSGDGSTSNLSVPYMSDNAQDLTTVFGGILRIDPLGSNSENGKYGIPDDNPFIDGPGGNVDELFAYGLRNPYRLDLDPVTGDIWMSETGEVNVESVERLVRGGNYGWNIKEGEFLYDKTDFSVAADTDANGNGIGDFAESHDLIDPVFQYGRADGRSVIGGVLYRGSSRPDLVGKYVFTEYFGGLFYGDPETGEIEEFQLDNSLGRLPNRINSIEEDANGELIALGIRTVGSIDGVVVRLTGEAILNCDFDSDADCDIDDIDALVLGVAENRNDANLDIDADGDLDGSDIDAWLFDAGLQNHSAPFSTADANLDGTVNDLDFLAWNDHRFTATGKWSLGDFNADGVTDVSDFNLWNQARSDSIAASVPEPTGMRLLLTAFALALTMRRSSRGSTITR